MRFRNRHRDCARPDARGKDCRVEVPEDTPGPRHQLVALHCDPDILLRSVGRHGGQVVIMHGMCMTASAVSAITCN